MSNSSSGLPLKEIQDRFFRLISEPLTEDDRARATLSSGEDSKALAESFIKPNQFLTSLERIELYNRQYWFRILDSLIEDFPGLVALFGIKKFHELSVRYVSQYPSRSYTLRDLGRAMGDFLRAEAPALGRKARIAAEIADFEWAHIVAFDSAELPPLAPTRLSSQPLTSLVLRLQPHLSLLELGYPLDEWMPEVRRQERDRSEAARDGQVGTAFEQLKPPKAKDTWLAVYRREHTIFVKHLTEPQYSLLAALRDKVPLTAALADAVELLPKSSRTPEQVGKIIQEWFTEWSALKWIAEEISQESGTH